MTYDNFNLVMEDEEDVLLTEQIQELLVKNHRVLFMQEKNQAYFADWISGEVYDLELDVYQSIKKVMKRVKEGKTVLKGFGYIHRVVQDSFMERTGTPSLEMVLGDLTNKMRGM